MITTTQSAPTHEPAAAMLTAASTVNTSTAPLLAKAADWLLSPNSPNAEGAGRRTAAISVARKLRSSFGLSEVDAVELADDNWNCAACSPSLARHELEEAFRAVYSTPEENSLARSTPNGGPAANPKLEAALAAARRGFSVFPLQPYVSPGPDATEDELKAAVNAAKSPFPGFNNWQYLASSDEARIRKWWAKYPDANIAGLAADLFIDDVDPRKGGKDSLDQLELLEAFPDTLRSRTWSGGEHIFYRLPSGVRVRGGNDKLGPGIDIKTGNAFVLLPGSVIQGQAYEWAQDRPIAEVPEWQISRCKAAVERNALSGKRLVDEDEHTFALCDAWLKHSAPAAAEGRRNDTAVLVAMKCYDYAATAPTCLDYLLRWNETHCSPPLDSDELAGIARSVERNRDMGIGCSHPLAHGFEPYTIGESGPDGPVSFESLLGLTVRPVEELISGLVEKGTVTFLSAPGGKHKSRLALQWGLCVDAGAPVFGRDVERATFVYVSYEDHRDEVTRRVQAITRRLQLPAGGIGRYWDRVNKDSPLAVVHESGACELKPFWTRLREYLRGIEGHKFVVLDGTYNAVRFAGQAKINETSVMAGIGLLQRLCGETDSTMLTLWHPSQSGQERGDATGWSVAWHNAPRARLSIKSAKEAGAERAGDGDEALILSVEKRNHGPKGAPVKLFWSDGALLPRSEVSSVDYEALLQKAVVSVATLAAEKGAPMQMQRRPEAWQIDALETETGYRPTPKEVKEALSRALSKDLLRYVRGSTHRGAGYYPADETLAAELAREVKRHQKKATDKG